ncbi:transcriptional regulator [Bradyrhizobium sp. Tv2a-2]|uniref:transcriptional regulator n=1 Tax=Bradyrhizobium sp. Tv2a-2 TaxID=113395 RepID=UPI0004630EDB|nr:transcriptional regulator [Bradyrhizobium sp. Tv2a-2]
MSSDEEIMKAQGGRLKQIRVLAGFGSARSASTEAGWAESTYRAHEAGTRTIDPKDADRYVHFFRTHSPAAKSYTGRWIIYGERDDLDSVSFDDLVAGESPNFRRKAYEAILAMKKRR